MKIFLYDAETGYEETDYEVDLEIALDEFYGLSDEEGSFFGIRNDKNQVIQFAWESEDKWLVDIPIDPPNLSLQRYANYDKCVEIIKDIYKGESVTDMDELYEVPIMKKTLDQVLLENS